MYPFPQMPKDKTPAETERFSKEWKTGPSGFLIVAPPGDMNMGKMLGGEFISNVIASLIAAWIVSLIAADKTFLWRWKAVVLPKDGNSCVKAAFGAKRTSTMVIGR
jgi:hypothetical protein